MLLMIMKKMDNDNAADNAKTNTKANNDNNDWLLFKSKGIVPYRT